MSESVHCVCSAWPQIFFPHIGVPALSQCWYQDCQALAIFPPTIAATVVVCPCCSKQQQEQEQEQDRCLFPVSSCLFYWLPSCLEYVGPLSLCTSRPATDNSHSCCGLCSFMAQFSRGTATLFFRGTELAAPPPLVFLLFSAVSLTSCPVRAFVNDLFYLTRSWAPSRSQRASRGARRGCSWTAW